MNGGCKLWPFLWPFRGGTAARTVGRNEARHLWRILTQQPVLYYCVCTAAAYFRLPPYRYITLAMYNIHIVRAHCAHIVMCTLIKAVSWFPFNPLKMFHFARQKQSYDVTQCLLCRG